MLVRSVTRKPLFIGGSGAPNHSNYTFSNPNNSLYTLFEDKMVTFGFVRVSSVSSHDWTTLHATPLVSSSHDALYTSDVLTCGVLL
jgi:hypothetical protein